MNTAFILMAQYQTAVIPAERVATVSGHRSWQSLKRYTHMDEVGDKWAGWDWAAAYAGQSAT